MSSEANGTNTVAQVIGPWVVLMEWKEGATQGGPRKLTIKPRAEATEEELAGGLSSAVLRRVAFKAAADKLRSRKPSGGLPPWLEDESSGFGLKELLAEGVTDLYLACLSSAYVYMVEQGKSHIYIRLAEAVGKKPNTIKAHLQEARRRELLTVTPGKAGGSITLNARTIVEEHLRKESDRG